MQRTELERFWEKVDKSDPNGCWIWKACTNGDGYGQFYIHGKSRNRMYHVYPHRYIYEKLVQPIPEGMVIDHLCKNRLCVNPTHLDVVTNKINLLRGNTVGAKNASKTHCPKGHPLTIDNCDRWAMKNGMRRCLTCKREQTRRSLQKNVNANKRL